MGNFSLDFYDLDLGAWNTSNSSGTSIFRAFADCTISGLATFGGRSTLSDESELTTRYTADFYVSDTSSYSETDLVATGYAAETGTSRTRIAHDILITPTQSINISAGQYLTVHFYASNGYVAYQNGTIPDIRRFNNYFWDINTSSIVMLLNGITSTVWYTQTGIQAEFDNNFPANTNNIPFTGFDDPYALLDVWKIDSNNNGYAWTWGWDIPLPPPTGNWFVKLSDNTFTRVTWYLKLSNQLIPLNLSVHTSS